VKCTGWITSYPEKREFDMKTNKYVAFHRYLTSTGNTYSQVVTGSLGVVATPAPKFVLCLSKSNQHHVRKHGNAHRCKKNVEIKIKNVK